MRGVYEERLAEFRGAFEQQIAKSRRLGRARTATFLAGFSFYLGWDVAPDPQGVFFGVGLGAAALLFVVLVVLHRPVKARAARLNAMAGINEVALARLERSWDALPACPMEAPEADHPFAHDLDLAGDASLFRLFTSVTLPPGLETLRHWLLDSAKPGDIRQRQEAVEELAPMVDFRQTLEAEGRHVDSPSPESIRGFLDWAESEGWLEKRRWILWVARALPVFTATAFLLYLRGAADALWWVLGLMATFTLGYAFTKKTHPLMELASGGQERFGRYAAVLDLLLATELRAPILESLQTSLRNSPFGAARELERLGRTVGWADVRYSSMAHAPLQAFFAWDIHVLAWLEGWKARSGPHVRGWLEALGTLEALVALATLKADHPDWCFPDVFDSGPARVLAAKLGHPLLPQETCVRNDLEVGPPGMFLFLTGSNMSGKSTLLRALGINAVLAQAGGPACAERLEMAPLRVQTSMRTADSLSEGVSQYMAELNRIRGVVDRARRGEGGVALFLLDEPLQGTNEAERRVAVQTILGHLLEAGAIGGVATHDLQLDDTDRLRSAASLAHLTGTVTESPSGPLLTFDYRLREGRATSTNALALLDAVGLGESASRDQGSPSD
jgi:hypothetical protein